MLKVKIGKLYIELTRRCNSACLHCMRGNAQNIDLTKEMVDKAFKSVDHEVVEIGELFLTGGEPFLNKEVFIYILNYIMQNNIYVNRFNCVTNSLIYDEDIMQTLGQFKIYFEKNKMVFSYPYDIIKHKRYFELAFSYDQFHKEVPLENIDKFSNYDFYYYSSRHILPNRILSYGRAKENNLGDAKLTKKWLDKFYQNNSSELNIDYFVYGKEKISISNLYLSAKGNFANMPDADASWDMIDNLCQYNILNDSIFTNILIDPFVMSSIVSQIMIFDEHNAIDKLKGILNDIFFEDYKLAIKEDTLDIFFSSIKDNIRDYLNISQNKNRKLISK